jgi:hypothetical protein
MLPFWKHVTFFCEGWLWMMRKSMRLVVTGAELLEHLLWVFCLSFNNTHEIWQAVTKRHFSSFHRKHLKNPTVFRTPNNSIGLSNFILILGYRTEGAEKKENIIINRNFFRNTKMGEKTEKIVQEKRFLTHIKIFDSWLLQFFYKIFFLFLLLFFMFQILFRITKAKINFSW